MAENASFEDQLGLTVLERHKVDGVDLDELLRFSTDAPEIAYPLVDIYAKTKLRGTHLNMHSLGPFRKEDGPPRTLGRPPHDVQGVMYHRRDFHLTVSPSLAEGCALTVEDMHVFAADFASLLFKIKGVNY